MSIITSSEQRLQAETWQWHLQNAVRDVSHLGRILGLALEDTATDFPLFAPLPWLGRIRKGDPSDPLLLQILPTRREHDTPPGYVSDPLRERDCSPARGLIRKYHGRALMIVTGACGIHCRYCFRRHFPYGDHRPGKAQRAAALAHIAADTSLSEIILSGGDPLVLDDPCLAELAAAIATIGQVTTLRIHTRMPVAIPQRVCDALVDWVARFNKQLVFVLHINHPNEIDAAVIDALLRLQRAGVTLLNQSVLLQGVNDTADVLTALSRRLFAAGTLPYYLHLPDPVAGAAHFDVADDTGRRLVAQMAARLPGYLVPKLARELPGADAKQVLA